MTAEPLPPDPTFGPFLSSELHARDRRTQVRAERVKARTEGNQVRAERRTFDAIVADVPEPECRRSQPEPSSLWRAVLAALGEMVSEIVRRGR